MHACHALRNVFFACWRVVSYTLYPIPYTLYPIPYTIYIHIHPYTVPYTLYHIPTIHTVPYHTIPYRAASHTREGIHMFAFNWSHCKMLTCPLTKHTCIHSVKVRLLPAVASCCQLLPAVASCCQLLPAVAIKLSIVEVLEPELQNMSRWFQHGPALAACMALLCPAHVRKAETVETVAGNSTDLNTEMPDLSFKVAGMAGGKETLLCRTGLWHGISMDKDG